MSMNSGKFDADADIDAIAAAAGFAPDPATREGIAMNLRRIAGFAAAFIDDPALPETEPLFVPFHEFADAG
ncbi:MAG: hypothetical protein AB7S92_00915 [Parvibaculaceae bacterium]